MNSVFNFLVNYDGEIKLNGKKITDTSIFSKLDIFSEDKLSIEITPISLLDPVQYKIHVKNWMAISGELDFHKRWNNGVPMPFTEMIGTIEGETPGMYKMDLHTEDNRYNWKGYVSKAAIISMEEI